ncbi:MAG: hypothetical protein ACYST0_01175 [Planctomycetota bacterium]|jgi:hypothetical protein
MRLSDKVTRLHLVALLVPPVVALAFFIPMLVGAAFLSDDYLLALFFDPKTGAVEWPEIWRDFGEGWFLSLAYWRPLISLSYAINIELFGFTPISLHAVNLTVHLVVVAATAHLCYRLCSREHRFLAGLLGGLFCAVHPVVCEPVLWIAARTSGIEVCFRMCALVAFASYLHNRRGITYGLVIVFSALALASKESAAVLPVLFLFVDVLDSPRRRTWERVMLHVPLCVLWLAYAVWRLAIFGSVLGTPGFGPGVFGAGTLFVQKLATLMAPDMLAGMGWVVVAAATVVLARGRTTTPALIVGLCAICVAVSLAPTYKVSLRGGMVGVRILYGSLPVLALLLGRCLLAGQARGRLGMTAGLVLVAAGLPAAFSHAGHYHKSWQRMRTAETQIAAASSDVEPRRPLGLLSVPACSDVPGPVNPMTYFAFGRRPFAQEPFAIAGLGHLLTPPPLAVELLRDPRPIHAFLGQGCPIAFWNESAAQMRWLRRDTGQDRKAAPAHVAAETGIVSFDAPRPIFSIEYIEIRATARATGGRLSWQTTKGLAGRALGIEFAGGVHDGAETTFHIDASRNGPLIEMVLEGRELSGLQVELQGGRILDVQVIDRVPRLELSQRFDGSPVTRAKLEATLIAPSHDQDAPMQIVLSGTATGFAWAVEPGAPVRIPVHVMDLMRALERGLEASRYHYYFATAASQGNPGSARSDLDWFRLESND